VLFHGWTDIAVRKHGSNATMLPAAFSIATIVTFNTANSHFAWHKASHYAISKNAESSMQASPGTLKEKKRKDYACRHQFDEKPSTIQGCPGTLQEQNKLA